MSQCISHGGSALDVSLAGILAKEIELTITVVDPSDSEGDDLVAKCAQESGCVYMTDQGAMVRHAMTLPAGAIATWESPAASNRQIAKHARAVLDLEISRNESKQLLAEVESLTNQVMQDFEELSLIRALASSWELPQTAEDTDRFVLRSLMPLADGVGAVAIGAVLSLDPEQIKRDAGRQNRKSLWAGTPLVSDDVLFSLVDQHADELNSQPIVRNKHISGEVSEADELEELVMVQCASEGHLHGWIFACNRVKDDVQDVPWAQLGFTTVQASLMETASHQLAAQLHNIRLLKQKERLFTDVIRALVNAVEARDPYTCGHSERVASFARCLASKVGFSAIEYEQIYLTGLLHDVGKIAIPDGVLQKPNQLNDQERAIIETHTDSGWRILQELEALQDVLPGVLYHHERWDGKGYPDQLEGENIPIDGRVLAVCDAFDAMTSDRPYRKGMSIEKAVGILKEGAGTYWDPRLINAFIEHISEIDLIRLNHRPRAQAARPAPVEGVPMVGSPASGVSQ